MKLRAAVVLGILSLGALPIAYAQNGVLFGTNLSGFEEAAPAAISTRATGQFDATISHDESTIDYVLTYANLEANATQAHIHFGRRGTSGGISVWLCSNLPSPPTPAGLGIPACPLTGGTVTGTITAASVVGPAGQGIDPGELSELMRAIRDGSTYVNVHSTKFQPGEIRGQLDTGHSH